MPSVAGGIEDLNLNNSYYILYGIRPADPVSGRLEAHNTGAGNPLSTPVRVNAVLDNQTDLVRQDEWPWFGDLIVYFLMILSSSHLNQSSCMKPHP